MRPATSAARLRPIRHHDPKGRPHHVRRGNRLTAWVFEEGLGPKVNHSCDPNCGVRVNDAADGFDFVALRPIAPDEEITFDYAMRNYAIEQFPAQCLCGTAACRGAVTGWKDLPAERKAAYGDLVAPYLRAADRMRRIAAPAR